MSSLRIVGIVLLLAAIGLGLFSWFGFADADRRYNFHYERNPIDRQLRARAEQDAQMYLVFGGFAAVVGITGLVMIVKGKKTGDTAK